ncbi:hypothetical protein FBU31_001237, partial [Coemansia sp. 'formosensis']
MQSAAAATGAGWLSVRPKVDSDLLDTARMAVVVDTNYFIDDLPMLRALSRLASPEQLVIVVPSVVLQELDGLKNNHRVADTPGRPKATVSQLARGASNFLSDSISSKGSAIRCQKVSEYLQKEPVNDDKILDCCLYIIEKRKLPVTMLTRDRNLSIKARTNGCATCGDWANGPGGLLLAILDSGGLQAQSKVPVDDAPIAATDSDGVDQRPSTSSLGYHHAPRRSFLVPKKAGRVSVKDAHRVKDSNNQRRGTALKSGESPRVRKRLAKQPALRDGTQGLIDLTDNVVSLDPLTRIPLPAASSPSHSVKTPVLGRENSDFTFSVPITSLSNNPQSGSIVVDLTDITDSDNDMDMDIDIDMRDDPDVQYIPPHRIGQRKSTPEIAAQPISLLPARSTSLAISSPTDLKPPADGQPEREIIYLDETPERNRRKEQSITMSLSAVDISRAVASFMHSTLNCRLTELFIDRLKKGLPSSYASDWCVTLSKDFDPPPWDSATVMLTIVLRYWDSIFSK